MDNVCRAVCRPAECAVLSVGYRRVPEHPFPAALEDSYAAVSWLADHGGTVVTAGFDPLRDERLEYADRLEADGVAVSRHHYEGMIHGFVSMLDDVDPASDAVDDVVADLDATF